MKVLITLPLSNAPAAARMFSFVCKGSWSCSGVAHSHMQICLLWHWFPAALCLSRPQYPIPTISKASTVCCNSLSRTRTVRKTLRRTSQGASRSLICQRTLSLFCSTGMSHGTSLILIFLHNLSFRPHSNQSLSALSHTLVTSFKGARNAL